MLKIFDTHAHYDDKAYDEDREAVIGSLQECGIQKVVDISADMRSLEMSRKLAEQYDFFYCTAGIHPCSTDELTEERFEHLKAQCSYEKCVAVGEIGLDYYWDDPDREIQRTWFERQVELAKEVNLPMIIHSREAAKETVDMMRALHAEQTGGVVHCYSYTKELARDFLDMGYYFGIGGVLTFQNAKKLKEAVEYIPLDRIVTETDAPYLAPVPYRGKRNSSIYLPHVIAALAQIKGMDEEALCEILWDNAHKLYRIQE
jgi:TatD DNase family protein